MSCRRSFALGSVFLGASLVASVARSQTVAPPPPVPPVAAPGSAGAPPLIQPPPPTPPPVTPGFAGAAPVIEPAPPMPPPVTPPSAGPAAVEEPAPPAPNPEAPIPEAAPVPPPETAATPPPETAPAPPPEVPPIPTPVAPPPPLTPGEQLAAAAQSGPLVLPGGVTAEPAIPVTPEPAPALFVTVANGAAPGYAIIVALPQPEPPDPLFISRGRVFDQHNIVRSSWDYRDVENYQVTYSSFDLEDKINDHPTGP
jgi:hypothetical protein